MSVPSPGNHISTLGIGADDLLVTEAVASRYVEQRVLVRRLDALVGTENRRAVFRQFIHGGTRGPAQAAEQQQYTRQALHVISTNAR